MFSETVSPLSSHSAPCSQESLENEKNAQDVAEINRYYPLGTRERHLHDEYIRKMKEAALQQRRERETAAQCSFQPVLTTAEGEVEDGGRGSNAGSVESTSVFERLARQAQEQEERKLQLEQMKAEQDAQILKRSFHPAINKRTLYSQALTHLQAAPVEERLLHYGKSVELSLAVRREQKRRSEEGRAGAPSAEAISRSHKRTSAESEGAARRRAQEEFSERNAQLLAERQSKREEAERAAEAEYSFRPKISATSAAIDELNSSSSRVMASGRGIDRGVKLYEQAMREKNSADKGEGVMDDSYVPATNPVSQQWIAHGVHHALFQTNFVKRQELYEQVRQEQQRALEQEIERERKEAIQTGSILVGSGGGGGGYGYAAQQRKSELLRVDKDMIDAQVKRLYYGGKEASGEMKQRAAEKAEAEAKCSFKPTLSPGTAYVLRRMEGREQDVVKRLGTQQRQTSSRQNFSEHEGDAHGSTIKISAGDRRNHRSQQQQQQPRGQSRSPSPSGSARVAAVSAADIDAFYERQLESVRRREQRAREAKRIEAAEELAECTFRPRTNATVYSTTRTEGGNIDEGGAAVASASQVSGVSRFLQRQAAARRLREEEEERARNMGRCKAGAAALSGDGQPTVLSPFKLQTEAIAARRKADKQQQEKARSHGMERVARPLPFSECDVSALYNEEDDDGMTANNEDMEGDADAAVDVAGWTHAGSEQNIELDREFSAALEYERRAEWSANERNQFPATNTTKMNLSALKRNDTGARPRRHSRSVSFVGVPPPTPSPVQNRQFADPYNVDALLSRLRTK